MEEEFYSSYKRKLDNVSGRPDDDVWKNISEAISESRTLPERKRRGIGFILVFFLTLSSFILYLFTTGHLNNAQLAINDYHNNRKISDQVNYPASRQTKSPLQNQFSHTKPAASSQEADAIQSASKVSQQRSDEYLRPAPKTSPLKKSYSKNVQVSDLPALSGSEDFLSIASKSITLITPPLPESAINFTTISIQPQDTGRRDTILAHGAYKKGMAVGASFVGHNPWLLNYVTRNAFDRSKPEILDFSLNYSLSAFVMFSVRKSTFQAECIFNQKAEQSYQTYSEGHSFNKSLLLKYTQFNLIDKLSLFKRNKPGFFSHNINFLCGISYGYLNSASRKINDYTENVTQSYYRNSYGVIAGTEYQVGMNRFFFTTSIRANIGVTNIYAGNPFLPKDLNQTYNSGFSFVGSIGYRIK